MACLLLTCFLAASSQVNSYPSDFILYNNKSIWYIQFRDKNSSIQTNNPGSNSVRYGQPIATF